MARPSKTSDQLTGHRTKRELAQRKEAEEKLLSGKPLKIADDVRNDMTATAEFKRVKTLMKSIGKDDALYSAVINRYCILRSEEFGLEFRATKIMEALENEDDPKTILELTKALADIDRLTTSKRKLMMDIEKENCMTVSAALRSIPKSVEKKGASPLMQALMND